MVDILKVLIAELIKLSVAAVLVGVVAAEEEVLVEVTLGLAVLWGLLGSIVMSVKHSDHLPNGVKGIRIQCREILITHKD